MKHFVVVTICLSIILLALQPVSAFASDMSYDDLSDLFHAYGDLFDAYGGILDDSEEDQSVAGGRLPDLEDIWVGELLEIIADGKTIYVHEDFKQAMDAYEDFFDSYISIMEDDDISISEFTDFMTDYAYAIEALERIEELEDAGESVLSDGDYAYFFIVYTRIMQKLTLASF